MWALGSLGSLAEVGVAGNSLADGCRRDIQEVLVLIRRNKASARAGQTEGVEASLVLIRRGSTDVEGMGPTSIELLVEIELKSLILAQIERWRHALHMQVERQRGATWRRAANG